MALVNKNGKTPEQVAQHEELTKQLENVLKQQEQLQQKTEALQQTMGRILQQTDTLNTDITDMKYDMNKVAIDVYGLRKRPQIALEEIKNYLIISVLVLFVLQSICFIFFNNKIKRNTQAVVTMENTLRGNAAYWYDAENHALYVREKESSSR